MTESPTGSSAVVGSGPDPGRVLEGLHSLPPERLAFSEEDMLGRVQAADLMMQAGLSVAIDDAFNVVGSRPGREDLAPIVLGSHLDTVPNPGAFDGALGILTAIECARVLGAARSLRHPLQVFGFSDEEGTATQGCWGARAVSGSLEPDEISALADASSPLAQSLLEAARRLAELGWSVNPLDAGDVGTLEPAVYLELHIEQGPVLERAKVPTAAVISIVGINRYEVIVPGKAGHAGTVPMSDRAADAVVRLAHLIEQYWGAVVAFGADAVVNFGRINVQPGSFNVIPDEARLAVEIRSPSASLLRGLEQQLEQMARDVGARVDVVGRDAPVQLDPAVRRATLDAAAEAGVDCIELPSWAGHDAAVLAARTRTGMIFVPSVGGASHCRQEHTDDVDVDAGLRVLLQTVKRLDQVLA